MIRDSLTHHDLAGLGFALQPARDVDRVSEEVAVPALRYLAEVDAGAESAPAGFPWQVSKRFPRLA